MTTEFHHNPILDSLATAIMVVDDGLQICYLNSAAEMLLELSESRAQGQTVDQLLAETEKEADIEKLHERRAETVEQLIAGDNVLTALALDDDRTVIVNRGFIPLGVDVGAEERMVARLACAGGSNVARNHARYHGEESCRSAARVAGGGHGLQQVELAHWLEQLRGKSEDAAFKATVELAELDARVFATVGTDEKREFCESLGAERAINYRDEDFVGVVKSVVRELAPHAVVIDLTHGVPPQEVRIASWHLANAWNYFPTGTLHVAVVDPGVGSERLPVAVRSAGRWFVGPDNGLFNEVARRASSLRWWEIEWRPEQLSASFHGRDLFAPVAARVGSSCATVVAPMIVEPTYE